MTRYTPGCPFCGKHILQPEETQTGFGSVLFNRCACGAVYVCDPTGHNTGEAYMEALALMKGDWNIDMLDPDLDYDSVEMDYDLKSNTHIQAKGMAGFSGKLLFIKSKNAEGREVAASSSSAEVPAAKAGGRVANIKEKIRSALQDNSLTDIVDVGLIDKGAIRRLISMAYDKEDVRSWRAVEALGLLAGALSADKKEVVRDTIRKLLWSMGEESGGIGWSAAEMLGEIIRNSPDDYSDIIPILWSFKDEDMFRSGIVWAMGRIGLVRPDLVRFVAGPIRGMLNDADPYVRGHAAWTLGIIGDETVSGDLEALADDIGEVNFYAEGMLLQKKVAEIAAEALNKSRI